MRVIEFLVRYANWKKTLGLLLIQFGLQAMILFWLYPMIGGQDAPLDMRTGLSASQIHEYLTSIGPDGRKIYALNEATLDMLFPLFYSFAYAFLFLRLISGMAAETSRWRLVCLLPFAIAIADFFENVSILGAIAAYPSSAPAWANAAAFFNMVKGSLMLPVFAALIALITARIFVFFFVRFRRPRTAERSPTK